MEACRHGDLLSTSSIQLGLNMQSLPDAVPLSGGLRCSIQGLWHLRDIPDRRVDLQAIRPDEEAGLPVNLPEDKSGKAKAKEDNEEDAGQHTSHLLASQGYGTLYGLFV